MILEVDAGNTRLKWRLLEQPSDGGRRLAGGQVSGHGNEVLAALAANLQTLPLAQVDRVRVCSVRNSRFADELSVQLRQLIKQEPEFARVSAACAGVTNSYTDVSSMGVDRWLAMLAAFHVADGAVCVADFGSAMTLDLVAASGQHLGGYIVPGLRLMQEALAGKSEALPYDGFRHISTEPGKSTAEAIQQGILAMQLALLGTVHESVPVQTRWFLCGGDAELISGLLKWPHEVLPELVMDGLALALP